MIDVRGLTMTFGDRTILDSIEFSVDAGAILAVMGSSGGGKTTLLRCIAGLIRPTAGSIVVAGVDVVKEPEEARHSMGMVFQSAALFDFLNVRDNVLFGARRAQRLSARQQVELVASMLDAVGLEGTERLMPAELSGGMRKRLGIARALALEPKVMLYDEPVTGLDPVTAYAIDRQIVDVRDRFGMTSIVVSHDVSSVFRIADRVAFLHEGRLAFIGTPAEFKQSQFPPIAELYAKSQAESFQEIAPGN